MSDNTNLVPRNQPIGPGCILATCIFLAIIKALFVISFGVWRYFSMTSTFDAGGTVSVARYEHLAYKIAGFPGVLIEYILVGVSVAFIFIGIGIYCYFSGGRNRR